MKDRRLDAAAAIQDAAAAIQLAAHMTNPRREAMLAILWGALRRMAAMSEDELNSRDRGCMLGELIESELAALTEKMLPLAADLAKGVDT